MLNTLGAPTDQLLHSPTEKEPSSFCIDNNYSLALMVNFLYLAWSVNLKASIKVVIKYPVVSRYCFDHQKK